MERQYLQEALEEGYWGGGRWIERLEKALQHIYEREVIVVSSGTSALHLALSLLIDEKDTEVIVPTWTFTATASEVVHAGGIPVLADVNESLHISPETVESLISSRTRGIIVVHYAGVAAPMAELLQLCRKYNLWLIEDACHAVPAYYGGQLCGTFGEMATLSFHATKPIAAGQGGAVLLSNPDLAERARILRRNGLQRSSEMPWLYEVKALGWNYMLSDFQAAVGLAQVARLEENWKERRRLALLYDDMLRGIPELTPYPVSSPETAAWHLYPVFWSGATAEKKNRLLQYLHRKGFTLNVHYKPLHLHPAYRPYIHKGQTFPTADRAYEEIFSLPLWVGMTEGQISALGETLKAGLAEIA
ncbi:MAG: DegT/DnrJ/EryC1/StrS family aminotransferase [Bacteroidia bacterium]|nr:DegT/DnrJ/EryC1/StrS family aminotransferase [Bacteroidia bacterium]MCX7652307.1 DegT/DnrJ/EryC1/StrS family aminotransferase [Bacteroidia bacterium]MDW8416569.1 DegT/DnrJ/EryC1/StrS family aminotransferase [Bacteroidia bacterium]